MKSKVALLALLVVAGCSKPAASDSGDDDKKPTVTVQLARVKAEPVDDLLSLQGAFAPSEGGIAKLAPSVAGRVSKVLVREGEKVHRGQVLLLLDPTVANAQENSARAAANAAAVQFQQSGTNLKVSRADQENNLETARIELQQARSESLSAIAQAKFTLVQSQADLQKLRAGARPQELAQAHEATVQATLTKNRAQSELDRDEALSADGYISKRQLEDARTALQTASSALSSAEDSEQLLKIGARPEEVQSAVAKVASAQEALTAAEKAAGLRNDAALNAYLHAQKGRFQVLAKEQDVANSRAAEAQKEADLAASKATVHLYQIVAPFDGTVVKNTAAPGDPADPATPLLYVVKEGTQTNFVASALPNQIASIEPGMGARISTGDQTFVGHVISLSPADTSNGTGTVRISVQGSGPSGLAGTAQIILKHHGAVPTVPDAALVTKDGKDVVFRNVKGVATQTEVKIGTKFDGKTAILGGLKAGDSIVAAGGNELDDGTKISAEPADKGEAKDKD